MLKKILLLILLAFVFIPCFAEEYKNKTAKGGPVFIYLYTPECGYCKKVSPNFAKLAQNNKGVCYFLSINANTQEGSRWMMQFNAIYVPYAVLMDTEKHTIKHVSSECMLEYACMENELKQFVK